VTTTHNRLKMPVGMASSGTATPTTA
jgi:hypothetical protein